MSAKRRNLGDAVPSDATKAAFGVSSEEEEVPEQSAQRAPIDAADAARLRAEGTALAAAGQYEEALLGKLAHDVTCIDCGVHGWRTRPAAT